ncbi:MAG: SusC/RagA family TonB-linked outer membrane protein [Bacteroidota bacterium]
MKNFYIILLTTLLVSPVWSQTITVSGKVTDSGGEGLPGVNLLVKGTSNGTVTDFNGNFRLEAGSSDILVVSFVGYTTQEIPVNSQTQLSIVLETDILSLNEVVVSAFGIKREKEKLGYSIQSIDSEAINRADDPNLGSALRGKFSGVSISENATGVGGSVVVNVRGISSLTSNNQALIVLDGVIIDENQGTQADFAEGRDFGNTLSNLNPSEIENISILKGGNATALYGSRAQNGVIVITTKSGRSETPKVEIGSSITFNNVLRTPDLQNEFGQGIFDTGIDEVIFDITSSSSFGPRLDGTLRPRFDGVGEVPFIASGSDDFRDFFQTGVSYLNSIAISQAKNGFDYRLSYSRSDQESIVPGSEITRQNFGLKAGIHVTKWARISGKVDYINQEAVNRPELTGGQSNISVALSQRPRNISNQLLSQNFLTPDGLPNNWQGLFAINPYYTVNTRLNDDELERYISLLELNLDPFEGFNVLGRLSRDFIQREVNNFFPFGAFTATGPNGRLDNISSTSTVTNLDLILTYNKTLSSNFDVSAFLGFSRTNSNFESLEARGTDFVVRDFFSLSNFNNQVFLPSVSRLRTNSVFASLTFGYNDYLFLELTGRNDWSSSLPVENASFFYPSVGLSAVLTDAIPSIQSNTLSNLKIRGSYAQTGAATGAFQTLNTFNVSSGPINGQRLIFLGIGEEGADPGPVLANPDLVNELSNTIEFGLEAGFLNNRIRLDATYFRSNTEDQILQLTLPTSAGASAQIINAGEVINRGFEVSLSADIIQKSNFTWNSTLNLTTIDNEVEELAEGVERNVRARQFNNVVQVAAEVGGSAQGFFGNTFVRNDQGQIIVGSDGLPVLGTDIEQIGSAIPDALINLTNSFTYKNFNFSFLLDARIGGDVFSFSEILRHTQGTAVETLEGRDFFFGGQGIPLDDRFAVEDGETLDPEVAARGVDPQSFWARVGQISENWVYDATFLKLREVTLGYSFPTSVVEKLNLQSLSISYVGRNLAILYSDNDNFDPETGFNTGFQGVEFNSIPPTFSNGFRVNLTF